MPQTALAGVPEAAEATEAPHAPSPYVFVVGCPRSGTTLLQRMLDSHPMLTIANDTHFIPRAIKGSTQGGDPALTPELVQSVRHYHRFHRLGLADSAVDRAARGPNTYSEFVSALYRELANSKGKPLAGEKTPDYVKQLPLLHRLFPQAKIIHIIRDGRDVALSLLEWAHEKKGPGRFKLWKQNPLATSALWWSRMVESGRKHGRHIGPDHYYEVRYEDLVTDSERELRRIADFLDLPYSPGMLAYHEGKVRSDTGLSAKKAWLPPTAGLRDWRSAMEQPDIELFEALTGELLIDLGYERQASEPPSRIEKLAAGLKDAWAAEKRTRRTSGSINGDFIARNAASTRVSKM